MPVLCVIGGCNGAGKTTLARELLPLMNIRRFLNADEIAKELSPLDPSLSAVRAGRLLIDESRSLLNTRTSFAIESTLSGKFQIGLMRHARQLGYHVALHYLLLQSSTLAVQRVALRVIHGGHNVPEADIKRRFERSRKNFAADYLPLADDWVIWDNSGPPHVRVADSSTHKPEQILALLDSSTIGELRSTAVIVGLGMEASNTATRRMLEYYRSMNIHVTPRMTLASS